MSDDDYQRRIKQKYAAIKEAFADFAREKDPAMQQCLLAHAITLAGIPDNEWVERSRRLDAMACEMGWTPGHATGEQQ